MALKTFLIKALRANRGGKHRHALRSSLSSAEQTFMSSDSTSYLLIAKGSILPLRITKWMLSALSLVMASSTWDLFQTDSGVTLMSPTSWCSFLCVIPSPWVWMVSMTCFQQIQYSGGNGCLFGGYTLYG